MGYSRDHPVYVKLRDDISSGRILPGSRLKFEDLSREYNTSTAPLREALVRLASEDIVHYDYSHGYVVRRISITELSEALRLMEVLVLEGLEQFSKLPPKNVERLIERLFGRTEEETQKITACPQQGCLVIRKIGHLLLTPVAERLFKNLTVIMAPFHVATFDLKDHESDPTVLIAEFIQALKDGDVIHADALVKSFFALLHRGIREISKRGLTLERFCREFVLPEE